MKLSTVELEDFHEDENGLSGWVNIEYENGLRFEKAWQMQVRSKNIVVTPSLKFKGILESFPRLQSSNTQRSLRSMIRKKLRDQYPGRCPNEYETR